MIGAILLGACAQAPLPLSPDGMAARSPSVASSGRLVVAVWQVPQGRGRGEGFVSVSKDGGRRWSEPVKFSGDENVAAGYQNGPHVGIVPDGAIHVLWDAHRVYATRSADEGRTWSAPILVSNQTGCEKSGFAVCADGHVYAGWLREGQLWFARSADGGASFGEAFCLSASQRSNVCECCVVSIVPGERGRLWVFFRNAASNIRDIYAARSEDHGETFGELARVSRGNWNMEMCPADGPSPALGAEGRLHVAWMDARDGTRRVYFSTSADGGATWADEVRLDPDAQYEGSHPAAATDPRGRIWVAWERSRGGAKRVVVAASRDAGRTFSAPEEIGVEGANEYPALVAGERLILVWENAAGNRSRARWWTPAR